MKLFLVMTIGTLVLVAAAQAADVIIPDPNLEAALLEALGKQMPPVTDDDLSRMVRFEAPERQIADLTGLEHATQLQELDLKANLLTDISVLAQLVRLQRLGLGSNQITDLTSLAELTELTGVDLAGNQISDISPLSGLTNLEELGLSENQISDLSPLAGLASLEELGLSTNQISDLSPLAPLTELRKLGLAENQITTIEALAGLKNLGGLTLSSNQISDISALAGLTAMQGLGLGSNQITDISPLSRMTRIEGLIMPSNQISDLSPLMSNPGLGSGDELDVELNPLDRTSITVHIPALQAKRVTVTFTPPPPWDVNSDGVVDISDLVAVGQEFGTSGEDLKADINDDGTVDIVDLVLVGSHFGERTIPSPAAPAGPGVQHLPLLRLWLTMAQSLPADTPGLARGKAVLEQLAGGSMSRETLLLPNYPNPFNPETWLPYQLAVDAHVTLRVYSMAGQLVKQLNVGEQVAGTYVGKHRAAYWDGTNQQGERVASGRYIYVLHADDYTATRHLLLVK